MRLLQTTAGMVHIRINVLQPELQSKTEHRGRRMITKLMLNKVLKQYKDTDDNHDPLY